MTAVRSSRPPFVDAVVSLVAFAAERVDVLDALVSPAGVGTMVDVEVKRTVVPAKDAMPAIAFKRQPADLVPVPRARMLPAAQEGQRIILNGVITLHVAERPCDKIGPRKASCHQVLSLVVPHGVRDRPSPNSLPLPYCKGREGQGGQCSRSLFSRANAASTPVCRRGCVFSPWRAADARR
jgi:hypothetical protein